MTVADKDVDDGVQEAQREGQARGRQLPRRQVPRGAGRRATPRSRSTSRTTRSQYRIGEKRKVRYVTIDQEALRAQGHGHRPADRARLQRQHPAVLDPRAGARQPHPAQDRAAKDDAAVKKQAEELLAQGQGGRRFRRAREEELAGRRRAPSRAATSTSSRSGQMVPEFDKVAFSLQLGADQRSREVAVRLPHHQGHRQAGRRRRRRSPRCARRSRTS